MLTSEQRNKFIQLYKERPANVEVLINITTAFGDITDKKFIKLRTKFLDSWNSLKTYVTTSPNIPEKAREFYGKIYKDNLSQNIAPLSWFLTKSIDSFSYGKDPMFRGLRLNMLMSYKELITYIDIPDASFMYNLDKEEFMKGSK